MKRPGFIDHRLIHDAWPQRRIGAIDTAPVLVLAANPGWDEADRAWENKLAASLRENLVGRLPNLFLDPLAHGSPGARWYERMLGRLLDLEVPTAVVAQAVCVVDIHGYHSPQWRPLPVTLPTQRYTFQRVCDRLEEDALVIITRARREWQIAVPELIEHDRVFMTKSVRTTSLSPRNLPAEAWEAVLDRVWSVHHRHMDG